MPDIASLGLELNSKQVVEGTKALDALATAAAGVEPKVEKVTKAADDLSTASAKVWRWGADAAKSVDALGDATQRTGQRTQVSNGQMNDTAKIMQQQAEQAKAAAAANVALGQSSNQASIGAQIFIDKLKDQVAVLGMSRSQLAAYQAAQLGVSQQARESVAALKAYEDQLKAVADAKAAATKQSNYLIDAIKILAAGYGALKLGEYIKDASLMAARYQTLGVVTEVVGRNAGYTKTQMDAATDAIARQGITMIESRESAVKLVQAHVDLKNATVLARIAQDAAVIGHLNSSDAFDRLVNGISRGNVLILRNIGINVNLQSAYRQMADELGKTTKELTENERVQARLNAVIERGADIAGTYEAAMDTAGKQLTSMQRYTQDLKTVIGETFNETLTIGVMALTDGLKGANTEMKGLSADGTLKEWGRDLTSVLVGVVNTISNIITMTKLAAVEAAHAVGAGDGGGIAYVPPDANPLAHMGSKIMQLFGASAAPPTAASNKVYEDMIAQLAGELDKFARAADVRRDTMLAKDKAAAEAKLKVDQDYATKATALLIANAGKSVEIQQAAQMELAKSVYVGTPTYRDTEGRDPKPKVDKVESTELADRLARIQDEVNAEKEMYETMSKMDDMFHAAGKMGDAEFYQNKRDYAAAAARDQIDGFNKQIADLKAYHNGTEAEAAKHEKQINDIAAKRAAAEVKSQDEINLLDAKEFLRKDAIASASEDATNKYLSGLDQEAKKLEESNAAHETSKGAVERETIARLDLAIAAQKQIIADQDLNTASEAEIAAGPATLKYLEDVRAARARIAAGLDQQQAIQYKDKAADQAIKDWQRAGQSIAESLTSAFGEGGKALGGMFQAYAKGMEGQLRAQKQLAAAKKLADDNPEKIAAINRAQLDGAQSQIDSYAGMTSAAQGFFSEGSRGYQAMHAATVALQGAEIALSLIKGVNAVLTQGEGDPYSAFARMAAMAAIVAGLGVAISAGGGGGGGQSAADVQKAQGTGSVFGDSDAKSDSIRRSIESLKDNSDNMLPINQSMLTALQNIESSMTGLTNLVVRTTGLTDGKNMGITEGQLNAKGSPTDFVSNFMTELSKGLLGPVVGGKLAQIGNNLWGKVTQNIVDSGLMYSGGVRDLQAGKGFNQYASVDTTKSSFFGLSKKTTNTLQTQGVSEELSNQFGLIFTNLDKALQAASVALGGSAADVTKVLDTLVLESTKVSLKGLTGTALTDALNSVISKSMDEIAQAAFPQFDQFRQVGEGYAETVMRLAGDYAKLDSVLAASSTTFGATGIASIAARENLIKLAGGIDQLASQSNSFVENFLSKAEQLAPVQKYVTDQLAAMGLQSLTTRDQFKEYTLGLANSGALLNTTGDVTTRSQAQYVALLALADAFAKTHAATEDLTKTEQEIGDERKDLQTQLDELLLTQAQQVEKARAAIDPYNRALFDQVRAAQLLETRRGMEITLMELQGDKAGVLAANRKAELAAMDSAVRPLQEQIYAQQDLAAAAQEHTSLLNVQAQIYALTGDKAAAAAVKAQQQAIALIGLSPALAAATKELQALQNQADAVKLVKDDATKLTAAVTAALSTVQSMVEAEKKGIATAHKLAMDALEKQIDLSTKSVEKLKSLSDALHSAQDSLRDKDVTLDDRAVAQAQIAAALAIAKAGGPLPSADSLKNALSVITKDSSDQFATYLDYQRDAYLTSKDLDGLAGLTDDQLTTEQKMLELLKSQKDLAQLAYDAEVARLDGILETAKTQVDILNGINAGVNSIPTALAALAASIKAAQANPVVGAASAIGNAYDKYLGRAPEAGAVDWWTNQAANGVDVVKGIANSNEAKIQALYQSNLGRAGEADGVQFYLDALKNGASLDSIAGYIKNSPEYQKLHPFAVGTNYVPGDMPALIHEGERIIPAADNRELMSRLSGPSGNDNSDLAAELRAMRAENTELRTMLESHLYAIAKNTLNTADSLDGAINGETPISTKEVPAEETA